MARSGGDNRGGGGRGRPGRIPLLAARARAWVRRRRTLVLLALLVAVSFFVPTDYFVISPGITRDLGPIVQVESRPGGPEVWGSGEGEGRFLMATVSMHPANGATLLLGWLSPRTTLRHRSELLPPGRTWEEYSQETWLMMQESQEAAKVAALRRLGHDVRLRGRGAVVSFVYSDGPAAGRLFSGDVIVGVGPVPVTGAAELLRAMEAYEVGDPVTMTVQRGGREQAVTLRTTEHPTIPGHAAVRINIRTYRPAADLPVDIAIEPGNISGPSAGMMFALEIVDRLDGPGDLARGRAVAGTGTIDAEGHVGPVGGVREKVFTVENAGAEVLFVAEADAPEARAVATRVTVVPVITLDQAVDYLSQLKVAAEGE